MSGKQHRKNVVDANPGMSQNEIRRMRKEQQRANRGQAKDPGGLAAKQKVEIEQARKRHLDEKNGLKSNSRRGTHRPSSTPVATSHKDALIEDILRNQRKDEPNRVADSSSELPPEISFRATQVAMASEHEKYIGLTEENDKKLAGHILSQFIDVVPQTKEDGTEERRLEAAIRAAKEELELDPTKRRHNVETGVKVALNDAFKHLTASKRQLIAA